MRNRLKRLQPWWQGLSLRERRTVLLGAALLGSTLWWLLLVQPALSRIAHWEVETPKLRSQAQALDSLLASTPLPPDPAQQAPALRHSLEAAGLGGVVVFGHQGGGSQRSHTRLAYGHKMRARANRLGETDHVVDVIVQPERAVDALESNT